MKKLLLEQGTEDWLKWRKTLLTATDAAMLLGKSPYVTPYVGWQRKLGLVKEQASNPAMLRGQRDEPIARDLFIKEYGINMTPCCIESEENYFIGASLDGLSDCGEIILEVKSQRPVDEVPDFHMMQIQHQLLCTDGKAKKAYYVSHWEGVNKTFEVYPDLDWMKEYLPKAKEFWKKVIFEEVPEITNKDYIDKSFDEVWEKNARKYKEICEEMKSLEDQKEYLRKNLIELCNKDNCMGSGVKVFIKNVAGRIDYTEAMKSLKIEEEKLEKFRKKSSTSWVIMLN